MIVYQLNISLLVYVEIDLVNYQSNLPRLLILYYPLI